MDKKKIVKNADQDDIRGFEEFIEGQAQDSNFLPRGLGGSSKKNEAGFENFTFLSNDGMRLTKLKELLTAKLPFSAKFDQSNKLIQEELEEVNLLRKKLFEVLDAEGSPYRKSLHEVFDTFFDPPK